MLIDRALLLTSDLVIMTACTRAIPYSLWLMHMDAAGMPTEAAIVMRVAAGPQLRIRPEKDTAEDSQISHQIGAWSMASFAQTTEFTN